MHRDRAAVERVENQYVVLVGRHAREIETPIPKHVLQVHAPGLRHLEIGKILLRDRQILGVELVAAHLPGQGLVQAQMVFGYTRLMVAAFGLGGGWAAMDRAIPYAAEDADITLMAYEALRPQLEELGLMDLFDTVEMPLVPVLLRMEMAGITVDQDRLRELSKSFASQLEALETSIHALAGEPFNIKSTQQLGRILF